MAWQFVLARGGGAGGGSGVGHGLTVTHYVSPFAEVSGASSDADAQNATAFTNASNPATPCTFQCALVNANGSHVVQVNPGTYQKAKTTEDATTAIFTSTGEGTNAANPLVFVAKYPAALNPSDASSWSQVRRTASDITAWQADIDSQPPLLGGGGANSWKSHVIWDGFYFDMEVAPPSATGLVMLRGSGASGNGINLQARRMLFDRFDWASTFPAIGNNNYNCIQLHTTTDVKVLDCLFRGGYNASGSHNESCVTTYACSNYLIQNCTVDGTHMGFYIKGGGSRDNYGTVKLNRFVDNKQAIWLLAGTSGTDTTVTQNLFYFTGSPPSSYAQHLKWDNTSSMVNWVLTNNTFAGKSTLANMYMRRQDGTNTFRDNISAMTSGTVTAGTDGFHINSEVSLSGFGTMNYNVYWSHNGGNQWNDNTGADDTIEEWRTSTGLESNSTTSINPTFADLVDFRISGSATTASSTGGPVGYSITGSEIAGVRPTATY